VGIGLNIDSNKILKIFKNIFWIIVVAKLLSEPLYFLLPIKLDFSFKMEDVNPKYYRFKISKIFNIKEKKKVKKIVKENIMPISNMILKGVYESRNVGFIVVTLKNSSRDVKIIGIGESFQGYKLIKIYPKKAIFERDGNRFILYMEDKKNKKDFKPVSKVIKKDGVIKISNENIEHYTHNFNEIFKNIGIDEIRKNGFIRGFKINYIRQNSIFEKIGLKKGDIIIKANDKPLRSYGDAFYFYNQIKNGKISSLKLTVLRNNKEKDIEYEIY